jgi:hypothetical protein
MIHENIMYGYDYDYDNNILIGRNEISNYGFFSTFTLLITAIMGTYNKYKKLPHDIDGRKLLRNLSQDPNKDMYKHFFHIKEDVDIEFDTPMPVPYTNDDQHTVYSEKYINYYVKFFLKYFEINDNIKNKINELVEKYSIIPENTISVIYRGTDKWTDMGGFNHISPALYMRLTKKLKEETPQYDVFIQSESSGINKVFNEAFGSKSIQETLVSTKDGLPLFLHLDKNKLEWSEYYVASLIIHSKSKILITYTGNSSFFVYLSRGTTKNMYQEITFTKNNYEDFFVKNN